MSWKSTHRDHPGLVTPIVDEPLALYISTITEQFLSYWIFLNILGVTQSYDWTTNLFVGLNCFVYFFLPFSCYSFIFFSTSLCSWSSNPP